MRAYVDTNVLVRLHLNPDDSAEAFELLTGRQARRCWPFPVTTLLRLEVINAMSRLVFESRRGAEWRVTPEGAAVALGNFEQDLDDRTLVAPNPLALEDLSDSFETLVARHTARNGFRTYDIIHVASALILGCDTFWSFDSKALKLAELEGLKTNRLSDSDP